MLSDIFGVISLGVKEKGLTDCWSDDEVDEEFHQLESKWKMIHANGGNFGKYSKVHKLHLIKNCMTAKVRTAFGLGFSPDVYTQNANECINSVLKRSLKGRKLSPKEAVLTIQSCVKQQQTQVKLAVINIGEFKLKEEYKHFKLIKPSSIA